MSLLFLICAVVGGTFLILQLALSLLGLGFDAIGGDIDLTDVGSAGDVPDGGGIGDIGDVSDIDSAGGGHQGQSAKALHLGKFITIQTIIAFLTFFGLSGIGALQAGRSEFAASAIGLLVGLAAMFGLGYVLASLKRLDSAGNVRLAHAVGCRGRVYLRIPGEDAGVGKVTLSIQGRTVEVTAKTAGPALANGTNVVVRRVIDQKTVEVEAIEETRTSEQVSQQRA